jgi:hypothetical protein
LSKSGKEKAQAELLELSRLVIDLKMEKKKYNAEINDQIKTNEAKIKELVGELSV